MAESARFRFGKIDLPQSDLPTPFEVYEAIEALDDEFEMLRDEDEDPVTGGTLEYREKGRTTYHGDSHDDLEFCHFIYVTDTENSIVVRNEDGEEEERDQPELVRPRVFYFKNGQFAFESRQELVNNWVPQFIGNITDTDIVGDYRFYSFQQNMMKDFYESRDHISVFKFTTPEDEGFEPNTELAKALNDLADDVESQQFSGGNAGKNLKETSLVDEAAEKMHILKLHGSRDGEYTMNILASGAFKATWSESDWSEPIETGTRAEAIFNRLAPQIRRLS